MTRRTRLVGAATLRAALGLCVAGVLMANGASARVVAGKVCSVAPVAAGAPLDCTSDYGWAQNVSGPLESPFLRLLTAQDVADTSLNGIANENDPLDCVAPLANKIIGVVGNAACTQTGSPGTACNFSTPSSCTLPCIVCEPAVTPGADAVTGLACPGIGKPDGDVAGTIQFAVNECRAPLACNPAPGGTEIIDESIFTGQSSAGDVRNARPGSSSICVAPPPFVEIRKSCNGCEGKITVVVTNKPGASGATACQVVDTATPGGIIPLVSDPLGTDPNAFDLPGGESRTFTGAVPPNTSVSDHVEVVCTDVCTPGDPLCQTTDEADAECTCGGDFKCYAAKLQPQAIRPSNFRSRRVSYSDQFSRLFNKPDVRASVLTPTEICNPVDKNGEGIKNPDAHLMCYKLLYSGIIRSKKVIDTDQFGPETLRVGSPVEICLPAVKNGVGNLQEIEARLNHYACYRAATEPGTDPFEGALVSLTDQFETDKTTTVTKTALHCNPILTKDGRTVPVSPSIHLKCYDIQDPIPFAGRRNVTTDDQWYSDSLQVGRATRLCETASKELLTPLPLAPTAR